MEAWPTKITRIQAQVWNETGAKPGARSSPGWREGGGAHPQVFPLLLSGLCLLRPERPGCERDLHPPRPERLASSFWCLASRLP